jgi:hypothetical protein
VNKNSPMRLFITIAALSLVAVCLAVFFPGCGENYSEGERTGVVTKLSKKGLFYKTWEGEMNVGGMRADVNGNLSANIFEFTINDDAILTQVQDAQRANKTVTLLYKQWFAKPNFKTDSGYIIRGIKQEYR